MMCRIDVRRRLYLQFDNFFAFDKRKEHSSGVSFACPSCNGVRLSVFVRRCGLAGWHKRP